MDVTDDASVETAMRVIGERGGRLDVLVNNAGIWDGRIGVDGLTGATHGRVRQGAAGYQAQRSRARLRPSRLPSCGAGPRDD
ncbi:MAG: SDR family NAD(P)-dependent oxidoreductase [Streptosporangiaceae bacterium]